jgi:hypothetical protein
MSSSDKISFTLGIVALLIVLGIAIHDMLIEPSKEQKPNLECCKPMGCCDETQSEKVVPHDP